MRRALLSGVFRFASRHRWSLPLSALAAICFERLGRELHEAELGGMDAAGTAVVARFRGSHDGVMLALTHLGNGVTLTALTLVTCVALRAIGRRREIAFLIVSTGGALVLSVSLKLLFHRARPDAELAYLVRVPRSFSFPSGHALGAMAVFASLAVVFSVVEPRRGRRAAAIAIAAVLSLGVAVSRVYLGVHFPSDVLGGQLAGAAWVSAVAGWFYPRLLPFEHAAAPPP